MKTKYSIDWMYGTGIVRTKGTDSVLLALYWLLFSDPGCFYKWKRLEVR
jgi:hypothetical protein